MRIRLGDAFERCLNSEKEKNEIKLKRGSRQAWIINVIQYVNSQFSILKSQFFKPRWAVEKERKNDLPIKEKHRQGLQLSKHPPQ
jgi:hypothetical protein